MSDQNGTLKTEIVIPIDSFGKYLFDQVGQVWEINKISGKKFGVFPKESAELVQSGTLANRLETTLTSKAEKELEANFSREVKHLAEKFALELSGLFDRCLEETEQHFRKEFVEKLGTQGQGVMREVVQKSFADIGKIWSERTKQKRIFSSWGPFPPQTRFWWQIQEAGSIYDMFLLEFPPAKRSVIINGAVTYVAHPWLCFLAVFKNKCLIWFDGSHRATRCAFWYFYRPDAIKSDKDFLHFSNLPHVWNKWPYMCCLGSSVPVIKLDDSNWSGKLLNYFWQSEFDQPNSKHWLSHKVMAKIPEISTVEKWVELSKIDPDKILVLPWPVLEDDIGTFASKVLLHFAKAGKTKDKDKDDLAKDRNQTVSDFKERLEEALYFLGSSFVLSPRTEDIIKEITTEKIKKLAEWTNERLRISLRNIAQETAKTALTKED